MADTAPTNGPARGRINWLQVLTPLLIVVLTASGSIMWYLLTRVHEVITLKHDIAAHEESAQFWKDKIAHLELGLQAVQIIDQETQSTVHALRTRLETGTDDRFRASDYLREKQILQTEIRRLEDLCETRYNALEKRLGPIESHFWQYHWNGGHGAEPNH